MRTRTVFGMIFCCVALFVSAANGRQVLSLDQGWRFHLGEVAEAENTTLLDPLVALEVVVAVII